MRGQLQINPMQQEMTNQSNVNEEVRNASAVMVPLPTPRRWTRSTTSCMPRRKVGVHCAAKLNPNPNNPFCSLRRRTQHLHRPYRHTGQSSSTRYTPFKTPLVSTSQSQNLSLSLSFFFNLVLYSLLSNILLC